MKIILPSVQIINPFEQFITDDKFLELYVNHCERQARKSHRSEDLIKEGSAQKLLNFIVMQKGDFSVIEHASVTVDFTVDRGVTHELVRHRIASYTQESTRFVNYEKKMPPRFIYPQVKGDLALQCAFCLGGGDEPYKGNVRIGNSAWRMAWMHKNDSECLYDSDWLDAIAECEDKYRALLAKKWRPQEARSVFPNALAADIGCTMNMRGWRHILLMRTTEEAHPQIEQMMTRLLNMFKDSPWGWLFEDVESGRKQAISIARMR